MIGSLSTKTLRAKLSQGKKCRVEHLHKLRIYVKQGPDDSLIHPRIHCQWGDKPTVGYKTVDQYLYN